MDAKATWTMGIGIVLALVVGMPWLTWWRATTPNPHMAVTETPIFVCSLGLLLLLALWIGRRDGVLAVLVSYFVLRTMPAPSPFSFEMAYLFCIGGVAVTLLGTLPPALIPKVKALLLAAGLCQVAYGTLQWIGYDPVWLGTEALPTPLREVRGTLGNRDFFGAYCALLLTLGPLWTWPLFAWGVWMSNSMLAVVTACAAVAWLYRRTWWGPVSFLAGVSGAGYYLLTAHGRYVGSVQFRLDVWSYALKDWWGAHPILGWGTAQWPLRIPVAQVEGKVTAVSPNVFVAAHNEYLQLLYDGGLIAGALLCWWIWTHRGLFTGPMAGVSVALAVNSLGNFPFHVGTTGVLAIGLLGLAVAEERSRYAEGRDSVDSRGRSRAGAEQCAADGHVAGREPVLRPHYSLD